MKVGGLDLARRRDFSALVVLERQPDRLAVVEALRLPHRRFDEQLATLTPLIGSLDRLAYDAGGVGDAVGELLPAGAIPVVIVAGGGVSWRNGRWHVGKTRLIGDLIHLAGAGRLVVLPDCPGADRLRSELQDFVMIPTRKGLRLQARGSGHDDLVLAAALAVFGARVVGGEAGGESPSAGS